MGASILKKLQEYELTTTHIVSIALGFLALGLIIVLTMIIWSRRRRQSELEVESRVPDFRKVWRSFLGHIPADFQHSISLFQHFVALGDSGSGKSLLVDLYTDWQGQARQFYPSYSSDPDLQVYLGSQVLVQELPSPLLNAVDPELRKALLDHWGALYSRHRPVVVITLKGSALTSLTPESLKQQAQLLRGKINILSRIRRGPIETRIVLTHMDQVEGYTEFTRFITQNRIPFTIRLKKTNDVEGLESCLISYERHLNRLLTTVPGRDFMHALAFLQEGPALFARLADFIRVLAVKDSLSHPPAVDELFLTSSTLQRDSANPYHLDESATQLSAGQHPNTRHRIAALAGTLAVVAIFSTAVARERRFWFDGGQALSGVAVSRTDFVSRDPESLRQQARLFLQDFEQAGLRPYLEVERNPFGLPLLGPNAYTREAGPRFSALYAESIRKGLLLPKLQSYLDGDGEAVELAIDSKTASQDGNERALYVIALLFADRNNALGSMIIDKADRWSEEIGLPAGLVQDYVRNNPPADLVANSAAWQDLKELDAHRQRFRPKDDPGPSTLERVLRSIPRFNAATEFSAWTSFFTELERFMGLVAVADDPNVLLITTDLESLQESATRLKATLAKTLRWYVALELCQTETLRSISEVSAAYDRLVGRSELGDWLRNNEKVLSNILNSVFRAEITSRSREPNSMTFAEMMGFVREDLSLARFEGDTLTVQAGERRFDLSLAVWSKTLYRSRLRYFLADFLRAAGSRPEGPFFTATRRYPSIDLNPNNLGTFVFVGKPSIEGRFTRAAFDRQVLKAAQGLRPFLDRLRGSGMIDRSLELIFEQRFQQAMGEYATAYQRAYRDFYRSFRVDLPSRPALELALQQIRLPVSPFSEFFSVIRDNTAIDLPTDLPSLAVFADQMRIFEPVNMLYVKPGDEAAQNEKDGKAGAKIPASEGRDANIAKFQSLMAAIERRLAASPAKPEPAKEEAPKPAGPAPAGSGPLPTDAADFRKQLSPMAITALDILRDDRDSLRRAVVAWLDESRIATEFQGPFLDCVRGIYDLGRQDIESSLARHWELEVWPTIRRVMGLYPFDLEAKAPANPLELTETLKPGGSFWRAFYRRIEPTVLKDGATWRAFPELPGFAPVELPKNLVRRLNFVQALHDSLWAETGEPKPLRFLVQPGRLAKVSPDLPAATLSYLTVGTSSVFGFNQEPTFQVLEFSWWQRDTAEVGLQRLNDSSERDKVILRVAAANELWPLFRLLDRAEQNNWRDFTWRPSSKDGAIQVVDFSFQDDPYKLLRFDPVGAPRGAEAPPEDEGR